MLGYIPSPVDDRDLKLVGEENSLFGAQAPLVPPAECLDHIRQLDKICNQLNTNTCVWNAMQQQHWIRQGIQGVVDRKRLSRMFGYWQTLNKTGGPIRDEGCMPRDAWKAAATMGFCTEKLWPFDPKRVLDQPDFDATAGAIDQQWLTGYYNLWGLTGRDNEAKLAISQGHPIVFGSLVDSNFMRYRADKFDGTRGIPNGTPVGRHMMCGVGYDVEGLWVLNSWGDGWGTEDPTGKFSGGFFRMSWEWVNWYQASDFWAIKFAEEFTTEPNA